MGRRAEELITDLAARQHGLVTRSQLLHAGMGPGAVKYRVKTKRLRPVQRGVYRVGPLAAPNEREMAALIACGPEAVLSHGSAAALWRLLSRDDSAPVDVTVRTRDRHRRPGLRVHRSSGLEPDDVATVDGLRTTGPARTVLDLASTVGPRELGRAFARAEKQDLTSRAELLSLIARHPRRRGMRVIRALLQESAGPVLTRSDAEERFLALIRKARLPVPEVNVLLGGHEVDFLWRAERLVVEVDGFAFHSSRSSFESDRRRDGQLSARGVQVIRVTWRQIVGEPEAMLVRLAQTLASCTLR